MTPTTPSAPAGVFAVQCPNPRCRKFMLVEQHDRGKTVACLLCKTPIRIAASSSTPPPLDSKSRRSPSGSAS
jgi:hypothetical protein